MLYKDVGSFHGPLNEVGQESTQHRFYQNTAGPTVLSWPHHTDDNNPVPSVQSFDFDLLSYVYTSKAIFHLTEALYYLVQLKGIRGSPTSISASADISAHLSLGPFELTAAAHC
jgi:hypothetical protein